MSQPSSALSSAFNPSALLDTLLANLQPGYVAPNASAAPIETDWHTWLTVMLSRYFRDPHGNLVPFGEHHTDLWDWAWSLERGVRPHPLVAIWPRGGGKSTSAEMVGALVGALGTRKYVLYICETQERAEDHVSNVAGMFESPLMERYYPHVANRLVGKYGSSKGWRRNRLRTASGFTVDAIGLDVAARGAKLDEVRPDLMIIDDIDGELDTPATVTKKIATLTRKLLPAGSRDLAVLALQNLIHPESIFSRLATSDPVLRADFLSDRIVSGPYPAVRNLTHELRNGKFVLTGGTPIWAGMDLARCQELVDDWGLTAFLQEGQQEVESTRGGVFESSWFAVVDATPVDAIRVRAWDLAATTDGDWTVGVLMARTPDGKYWVEDVVRVRQVPGDRDATIKQTADLDGCGVHIVLEEEGGSGGKSQSASLIRMLAGYHIDANRSTGSKRVRAYPFASQAKVGNVKVLKRPWTRDFLNEHQRFTGEEGKVDDQVDASDSAFNVLAAEPEPQEAEYLPVTLPAQRTGYRAYG